MEYLKLKGIVIRAASLKESDKLCDLFTLEMGVIPVSFKGAKKAGAKLKGAAQAFCFGDFELVFSSGRYTVTGAELTDAFYDLAYDAEKFFLACMCLEFIVIGLEPGDKNPALFFSLLNALKELAYSGSDPYAVSIKFLLDALGAIGYSQTADKCAACGNAGIRYYDAESGGTVCGACKSLYACTLDKFSENNLRFISNTPLEKLGNLKLEKLPALLFTVARSTENLLSRKFRALAQLSALPGASAEVDTE